MFVLYRMLKNFIAEQIFLRGAPTSICHFFWSVYLSVCHSVCLSVCLSVCVSVCLSVCLSGDIFFIFKFQFFWMLTHFMLLISFDTTRKQKTIGFLMFTGVSKEISGMKWVEGVKDKRGKRPKNSPK